MLWTPSTSAVTVLVVFSAVSTFLLLPADTASSWTQALHNKYYAPATPKNYVVLPVTESTPAFCRVLFSLLVNDFKAPILLNWGRVDGGNHYSKITALNTWLSAYSGHKDDNILYLDGHDVLAQLPSRAFFQQYTTHPQWPGLLAGAQKVCWPGPISHRRCADLPESPLDPRMYGDLTDIPQGANISVAHKGDDPRSSFANASSLEYGRLETLRPRFLNSGTIIGKRSDYKKVYTAATTLAEAVTEHRLKVTTVGSDQEILGFVNMAFANSSTAPLVQPEGHLRLFQIMKNAYKDVVFESLASIGQQLPREQWQALQDFGAHDSLQQQVAWNHMAKTVPTFIHFPGPKEPMEYYWSQMWWMQENSNGTRRAYDTFVKRMYKRRDREDGYGAQLPDGTWLSYAELCPVSENGYSA